jgi:hypothetical protein
MPADYSSRRLGTTANRIRRRSCCVDAGMSRARQPRARGHAANRRLHHRWERFEDRTKRAVVANAAIARELAAWCWSLAVLDE